MVNLIFIFLIVALLQFVYEAIFLPQFRLNARLKIFEQRDALRALDSEMEIDNDVFEFVERSMNNAIKMLSFLNLIKTTWRHKIEDRDNSEESKRIKLLIDKLNQDENKELKNIYQTSMISAFEVATLNALPLAIYSLPILLPLAFLVLVIATINGVILSAYSSCRDWLIGATESMLYLTNTDRRRFAQDEVEYSLA